MEISQLLIIIRIGTPLYVKLWHVVICKCIENQILVGLHYWALCLGRQHGKFSNRQTYVYYIDWDISIRHPRAYLFTGPEEHHICFRTLMLFFHIYLSNV